MSAVDELYEHLTDLLDKAYAAMDEDIARINESEPDIFIRMHKVQVRRARRIVETADIELRRMMIMRELAVQGSYPPIVNVNIP